MAMFPIERNYIGYGSSRPGIPLSKVRFIVSHDTGILVAMRLGIGIILMKYNRKLRHIHL